MVPARARDGQDPVTLVGSYDRVARILLDYVEIGVSALVIGHDPEANAADCAAVVARVCDVAEPVGDSPSNPSEARPQCGRHASGSRVSLSTVGGSFPDARFASVTSSSTARKLARTATHTSASTAAAPT
jgi:hypothetical protein